MTTRVQGACHPCRHCNACLHHTLNSAAYWYRLRGCRTTSWTNRDLSHTSPHYHYSAKTKPPPAMNCQHASLSRNAYLALVNTVFARVVRLVVTAVKAATLEALTLSLGGCLRQCLEESLESGIVEVQRRLQEPRWNKNHDGTVRRHRGGRVAR